MPWWISGLLVVLPFLIVDINELLQEKNNNFFNNHLSFFPLLLPDNDRKFLLPFLYAIVNLCHNSKGIIGYLIYELKRTFPEELQSEILNPTVRKVSMQHLTKLKTHLLLGLKAAAVTMKRIPESALLLHVVSIDPWPGVNCGSRTPIWLSVLCKLLSYFFFILFSFFSLAAQEF